MSYILDALRRAEAERERKRGAATASVLHAPEPQPDAVRSGGTALPAPAALPPAVWVSAGAALMVALALGWVALRPGPHDAADSADPTRADAGRMAQTGVADGRQERPQPVSRPDATVAPMAPLPSTRTAAAPPPEDPALSRPAASPAPARGEQAVAPPVLPTVTPTINPPVATVTPSLTPTGSPSVTAPPPAATLPPAPQPTPLPGEPARNATTGPATVAAPSPAPSPSPLSPSPAARRTQAGALPPLPEPLQRQLVISGSRHADDPAQRLLIVNGQVVREGGALAPGLVLERIQLRSAIVAHQGQRYELRY